MPYKSEKIKLEGLQDRRRKLTEEQREEIRRKYAEGKCGTRPLAKEYGVSRSLVRIIVNPDRAQAVHERIAKHWRDYHPDKEEWAEIKREHRHYKQELYLKGELKDENKPI